MLYHPQPNAALFAFTPNNYPPTVAPCPLITKQYLM